MKIAFYHLMSLRNGGGCENNFIRMAAAMAERDYGNEVYIAGASESFHEFIAFLLSIFYGTIFRRDKIKFSRLPESEISGRLGRSEWKPVNFFKLRKLLHDADVIYAKNEILDLFALKCLRIKKPVICGLHTNIYYPVARDFHEKLHNWLYSGVFYRFLIGSCCLFRVLNQDDKEYLIKRHKVKPDRIAVIGNGVDIDKFVQIDYESDRFNVLFVGRLAPQKGILDLADIILDINRLGYENKISFTVVGEGALKELFVARIGNVKNVELMDRVTYSDMNRVYRQVDICVVPSYWETFNSVILEAQSCGVPVIAYDIPGPREMIIDQETGFLIDKGKKPDMVQKILCLYNLKLSDRQVFNNISQAARKNIVAKFSQKSVFSRLHQLFLQGGRKCADL